MKENNENKVKQYFEVGAKDFDDIYNWMPGTQDKSLKRLINKLFRKGMIERFKLALEECEPNKTILDVGCGSGRISIALAELGARITGIDYSLQMIELANEYLKKYEIENNTKLNIKFIYSNFIQNYNSAEKFDVSLALGVTDYIQNPIPLLLKMKDLSKEKLIVSYPAKFTFQMPLRKIWLWTKKCPVYFYTKKRIKAIYNSINLTYYEIIEVAAGYFVKAYINSK